MREFKLAAIVGALVMLALPMSSKPADAVVYNLTLTDSLPPGVSGTGILEVINPPQNLFSVVNTPTAQVPVFSISIGSSLFDLSDTVTAISFSNGNVFNITAFIVDLEIPAVLVLQNQAEPLSFSYSGPNNETGTGFITATVAAAVPEASTWLMMLLGFAGAGFMAYRRSRKDQGLALAA